MSPAPLAAGGASAAWAVMASSVGCRRASSMCNARARGPMATNVWAMTSLMSSASVALILVLLLADRRRDPLAAQNFRTDPRDLLVCGQHAPSGQIAAFEHSSQHRGESRGCDCGFQHESEAAADVQANLSFAVRVQARPARPGLCPQTARADRRRLRRDDRRYAVPVSGLELPDARQVLGPDHGHRL